jgi:hypothetical protein
LHIQQRRRTGRRSSRRFVARQKIVLVRCTSPCRRGSPKALICTRFSNLANAFLKIGLTSKGDALNCAVR